MEGSPWMEWHWHYGVGIRQQLHPRTRHERRKDGSDRATTVVFQGMDEFAQGALVLAGATSDAEDGR